jgi:hypothetical protein
MTKNNKNSKVDEDKTDWGVLDEMEYMDNVMEEVQFEDQDEVTDDEEDFESRQKMMEKMKSAKTFGNNADEEGFQIIGMKNHVQNQKQTMQNTSSKFLPINLPLFESVVEEESKTKYTIPITVTIKTPQNMKLAFKSPRMLVAMLKAFQMAAQDTYIGPIQQDSNEKKITHHTQVPLDDKNLKKYMLHPVSGVNSSYSIKIVVHANQELKMFLADPSFKNYVNLELISIEQNSLKTAVPYNIGFLEQITSTRETTRMHTKRLKKIFPKDSPDFQVTIQRIYAPDKRKLELVMVQCNKDEVDAALKLFMAKKYKHKIFVHAMVCLYWIRTAQQTRNLK